MIFSDPGKDVTPVKMLTGFEVSWSTLALELTSVYNSMYPTYELICFAYDLENYVSYNFKINVQRQIAISINKNQVWDRTGPAAQD